MNASTVKADTLEPRHVYKKKSQIREGIGRAHV